MKRFFVSIFFLSITLIPSSAAAFSIGDSQIFNVESTFDLTQRDQLTASLKKTTNQAYFYFDNAWWSQLRSEQQIQVTNSLNNLGEEFDGKIYPVLTQAFGDVWNPGIDKDTRITILFHPMKEASGGYFNSADEYTKAQIPKSNEREMLYLNANQATSPLLRAFLAHEFQHLISFNQKERLKGVTEDVWLNEARSEYAATLLGYDSPYEGSNLERRVRNFLDKPYDSLTEWKNQSADYGVTNLFIQYLVDHYGVDVLKESMFSSKTGIDSLNEVLKKLGFTESFSEIFTNWTVASFVNDCNLDVRYCYLNESLRSFRIVPQANFLPPVTQTSLSVVNTTKEWSGNWYKFFGAKGNLTLEFNGNSATASFKIPYLLEGKDGKTNVDFMSLDGLSRGRLTVKDFDKNYFTLIIIPSLRGKSSNFSSLEPTVQFSWTASAGENVGTPSENPAEIEALLNKIAELKQEIARLQQLLSGLKPTPSFSCSSFPLNLYYGLTGSPEVRCLQEFLKSRGEGIYPEKLVTGSYLSLTVQAVKRYQAQKGIVPTGYFGPKTRAAANLDISK
ncbi:MAG: peptidoglycan-binding protein [Candidatus Nealsonbacteria bacterium]|nr:peptidoglycan-binding protein [Candidatus Nealsonbacteria bacterium]